ncbi:hypothetical protein [Deinococcus multiflagellatus]|uniref:Uncharacterized protein n=1 Tax=Deinococcus multiflagellatus TaxID=1656887 RepID=A0ABW1ZEV3_9DEIO
MQSALDQLTPNELRLIDMLSDPNCIWAPQPGPQLEAYFSPADILFYGGAAGGGKRTWRWACPSPHTSAP